VRFLSNKEFDLSEDRDPLSSVSLAGWREETKRFGARWMAGTEWCDNAGSVSVRQYHTFPHDVTRNNTLVVGRASGEGAGLLARRKACRGIEQEDKEHRETEDASPESDSPMEGPFATGAGRFI
jgi:hypothetical protein